MTIPRHEFVQIMESARNLSTWGPNFHDDDVVHSWYEKLKDFPLSVFKKSLATLAGQKYFPACADLVTVCNSLMNKPKAEIDMEKESSATYLSRIGRIPFTEQQKRTYNTDKAHTKQRQKLTDPLFSSNEMEYLKNYYPEDWKIICHEISNLSYFDDMKDQFEQWRLNPTKMIAELMPQKKFDWSRKFNVKFD